MKNAVAKVAILMGSDSDWPTLQPAAEACDEFGVVCEVRVVSAHRTPDEMARYAKSAYRRGRRVIIAGAGGGGRNAGLLAVQILAAGDPELHERFRRFKRGLASASRAKDRRLQDALHRRSGS